MFGFQITVRVVPFVLALRVVRVSGDAAMMIPEGPEDARDVELLGLPACQEGLQLDDAAEQAGSIHEPADQNLTPLTVEPADNESEPPMTQADPPMPAGTATIGAYDQDQGGDFDPAEVGDELAAAGPGIPASQDLGADVGVQADH